MPVSLPIVEDSPKRVRVLFGGKYLVDSKKANWQNPNYPAYFFPAEDIPNEFLKLHDREAGVEVFDVVVEERRAPSAVTSYSSEAKDFCGLFTVQFGAMDAWFEEEEQIFVHCKDPYKRVDVLQSSRHIRVEIEGVEVANTRKPRLLYETGLRVRTYIPKTDCRMDLLEPSELRTQCPYKGEAEYYHVHIPSKKRQDDVIWWYRNPTLDVPRSEDMWRFTTRKWTSGLMGKRKNVDFAVVLTIEDVKRVLLSHPRDLVTSSSCLLSASVFSSFASGRFWFSSSSLYTVEQAIDLIRSAKLTLSMATSAFGQSAAQQPAGGLFGQPAQQQSTGVFGQTTQQPTNSFFGQPSGQQTQQQQTGGLFGQSTAGSSTTQAATGGLFGQPPNQPSGGGLFGQSTTQPASGGGGLFGQSATQPATTGGGLFGQPAAQPAAGGGLFGQSTTQNTGGGLFGQSTSQPAAGSGGLFGQSTTQNTSGSIFGQSTTQPTASGGGLFGQSTMQPSGGGLFGQSTMQPSSGGLFGQSTTQPTSGGLFGQTQPVGGNLFGGSTLQAQPILPAGGLFGNNQLQQSQTPTGLLLCKSTKFNDLPDDTKRILEGIDSYIQGRLQISKDLHQRKLGEEPLKAQELLQGIRKVDNLRLLYDLMNISAQTRDDFHLAKDMKSQVDQAVQDTIVAIRLVDAFKAPQGSGTSYLNSHANFPLEFFARVAENMSQRLVWYKSTIEQIERKLSSSTSQLQTPHGIAATLQAQHATFLSLASKTAALDVEFQKIKVFVTQLWRAKTGSVRDPFNELDRTSDSTEFGIHSLGIK
ncbi:hypothetical protein C0995_000020 [Termitomyces sp. Mi166|nr:hypothetical protein C0995_000020 [Termitomyces sp. Mi166\